jgi:hypothetical protein
MRARRPPALDDVHSDGGHENGAHHGLLARVAFLFNRNSAHGRKARPDEVSQATMPVQELLTFFMVVDSGPGQNETTMFADRTN